MTWFFYLALAEQAYTLAGGVRQLRKPAKPATYTDVFVLKTGVVDLLTIVGVLAVGLRTDDAQSGLLNLVGAAWIALSICNTAAVMAKIGDERVRWTGETLASGVLLYAIMDLLAVTFGAR